MLWTICDDDPSPTTVIEFTDTASKQLALRTLLQKFCDNASWKSVYEALCAMPDGDRYFLHIHMQDQEFIVLFQQVSRSVPAHVVVPRTRTKDDHRPASISRFA